MVATEGCRQYHYGPGYKLHENGQGYRVDAPGGVLQRWSPDAATRQEDPLKGEMKTSGELIGITSVIHGRYFLFSVCF